MPYPDFQKSAKVLDRQRLGKQRVEAWQILQINLFITGQTTAKYCPECKYVYLNDSYSCRCLAEKVELYYKDLPGEHIIPWENHPAVLMWRGYEVNLAYYGWVMCKEWKYERGYNDTLMEKFYQYFDVRVDNTVLLNLHKHRPKWLGNKQFHLSHQSNLVRKYPEHYRRYFPKVPDNLEYFWPTKEGY